MEIMALLASVLSDMGKSAVSGAFQFWGQQMNINATKELQEEERAIANKQFNWGQTMDRFDMAQKLKQDNSQGLQNRISQLNSMLQTNVALQDRVRNLYARRG